MVSVIEDINCWHLFEVLMVRRLEVMGLNFGSNPGAASGNNHFVCLFFASVAKSATLPSF